MPAVAVIRREQVLFGIIGRKGYVDGFINFLLKTRAQLLMINYIVKLEFFRK